MTTRFDELVVPGLFDSGPEHWQTHWLESRPQALKVDLGAWDAPVPDQWVGRLDRSIARRRRPVFLIAHSLGCLAVSWWAQQASQDRLAKVRGALLVAPPDVDRPDVHPLLRPFAPAPRAPLPFPAMLVASRTDPYARFASLVALAEAWDAELVDAGDLGHINAASDLGDWPDGLALLDRLRSRLIPSTRPQPARMPDRPVTRARSRRA
jgi:predicted alpha/beta hydrolase family esterase